MTQNDSAVYYKERAWHNLGTVIPHSMSVMDAYDKSGLGWEVEKTDGILAGGQYTDSYCGIIRQDTAEVLGVVTPKYQVLQNNEVFDLATYFGSVATVESAGSIQGGRKCYLLLHGQSFEASKNDPVEKYMALIWGHDGTQSLVVKPTSIRVVCKNTMDMVLNAQGNQLTIKHHGDVEEKIQAARQIISQYRETGLLYQQTVQDLARKPISHEQLRKFFFDVYQLMRGPISVDPTTEKEEAEYINATQTIATWDDTFEHEVGDINPSPWIAVNAVTNWIQHREPKRGRKASVDSKSYSNIVGKGATETKKVMQYALSQF
jgi:phage/plasmid-like protein (TIGR03299 family)